MGPNLNAAVVRGLRTFVQAFLVLYPGDRIVAAVGGTAPFDLDLARSAAASAAAAVVALVWRAVLDRSPVPSLKDADQA